MLSAIDEIFSNLRNASDEALLQHAQSYYEMKERDAMAIAEQEEDKLIVEEAEKLWPEILKELRNQVVFTNYNKLKSKGEMIEVKRKGITLDVFSTAFMVPLGATTWNTGGDYPIVKRIKNKYTLFADYVQVDLEGDELTASTFYFLKDGVKRFKRGSRENLRRIDEF